MKIPKVFECFYRPMRYKVAYGGRGTAKSWSFARMLLRLAEVNKKLIILCAREIQKSIKDSVYALLVNTIIKEFKFNDWYITNTEIVNIKTKSKFIFLGLKSNANSIASLEGVDIVWIEEANKVSDESWDYLIPTIRTPGSEIWITFNPDSADDPAYKRFILTKRNNAIVKKIHYSDNPFFPDELKEEMEFDRISNHDKYMWTWEGNTREVSEAQIMKDKYVIEEFETHENVVFLYGVDFGSTDPSTMIRCYEYDKSLYIDYEVYKVGADNDDLPAMYDTIPESRLWQIRADNSRPDTIKWLKRHGFPKMTGPPKLKIEDGIAFIRSYEKIVIHSRCIHTAEEFKLYKYKTDQKTGIVTPKIIDANNHLIDALRYALYPLIKQTKQEMSVADYKLPL
jgi:phage terminase large subunit